LIVVDFVDDEWLWLEWLCEELEEGLSTTTSCCIDSHFRAWSVKFWRTKATNSTKSGKVEAKNKQDEWRGDKPHRVFEEFAYKLCSASSTTQLFRSSVSPVAPTANRKDTIMDECTTSQ
jgi:hypothetical protein